MTDFRRRLREAVEHDRDAWTASRRLVGPAAAVDTLRRLAAAVAGAELDPALRDELLLLLSKGGRAGLKALPQDALRGLTGLNPTKAIRNLCLLLGIGTADPAGAVPAMTQDAVEAAIRGRDNPFDVLLEADVASLVDFGAGDLTFEEHVVEQYLASLERAGRDLVLHALDRLDPREKFGGLVLAERDRLDRLRRHPSPRLQFHFDGNQDMFDLGRRSAGRARYTVAVCNSPATPTFAYEPLRLGQETIQARLRETKGEFRKVRVKGREMLQVIHGGEPLTFPAWKFDVQGPLALLDLLSRKGKLCILSAVDMEVFRELLSQLLPDDGARPQGVFFSESNAAQYFGPAYECLLRLAVGEKMVLPGVRRDIPRVLGAEGKRGETHGFRYVEIRRGAVFPGVPAGRTALIFGQMAQEAAPWFLTLVPAD
ncbi:MAG: hypothetical protein EPO02_00330 [Nitrospirae bacterium]|nr:MAG: hypothetical protein EPO02_00330 [Nitrospirota bacterium]